MRNNVTFSDLVAIARRVGVQVIEAPSSHRGTKGTMGTVRGVTCHHTGTPNTFNPTVDYPDFNVVKEGRAGLVNSLSAWGIGRFRAIYVFSEFLSWHAGEWSWKGLTDGNGDFLGIEAAGVGDWTNFQRAVYPRLVASALLFLGEGPDMAPRHLDGAMPRGRKVDAAKFDGNFALGKSFREWVEFFMANPQYININYVPLEEDPLAAITPEEIKNLASDGVANREILRDGTRPVHTWEILRDLYLGQKAESAAIAALTKLVAAQNGLRLEDVRAVVREEIAAGLDVTVTVNSGA